MKSQVFFSVLNIISKKIILAFFSELEHISS